MSDRIVREAIMHLAGTHNKDEMFLVQAEVDSVDIATRTCNVTTISGRTVYSIEGVNLMATVDDGILITPTVGSVVFVIHNKRDVRFVVQFSEIDKILYVINDTSIEMTDGKIQLNDGSYDGLVKVGDLVTKLNNLENLVNQFIGLYNAHVHASNGVVTTSVVTKTLTPTQQSDLENTKITHGK